MNGLLGREHADAMVTWRVVSTRSSARVWCSSPLGSRGREGESARGQRRGRAVGGWV